MTQQQDLLIPQLAPPSQALPLSLQALPGNPNNQGPEYWDFGHAGFMPQQLTPDYEFSELRRSEGAKRRWNTYAGVVLGLIFCAVCYCAYDMFINNHNPFEQLLALFDDQEPEAPQHVAHVPLAKPVPPKPPAADALKAVKGNPYWALPNRLLGDVGTASRAWNPGEETALRNQLGHRFRYQHYKAVQELRRQQLGGSEGLYSEALNDKGFWVRMFALVGLAEFGVEVPVLTVRKALGGGRSDLVANFFTRFAAKPSAAQLFLLRQALRTVDSRSRLVILKAIAQAKDPFRDLYLVAATFDPAPRVQRWVGQELGHHGLAPEHKQADLVAIVRGQASPALFTQGRAFQQTRRPAANIMSQDEVDQQADDEDDGGNANLDDGDAEASDGAVVPQPTAASGESDGT